MIWFSWIVKGTDKTILFSPCVLIYPNRHKEKVLNEWEEIILQSRKGWEICQSFRRRRRSTKILRESTTIRLHNNELQVLLSWSSGFERNKKMCLNGYFITIEGTHTHTQYRPGELTLYYYILIVISNVDVHCDCRCFVKAFTIQRSPSFPSVGGPEKRNQMCIYKR